MFIVRRVIPRWQETFRREPPLAFATFNPVVPHLSIPGFSTERQRIPYFCATTRDGPASIVEARLHLELQRLKPVADEGDRRGPFPLRRVDALVCHHHLPPPSPCRHRRRSARVGRPLGRPLLYRGRPLLPRRRYLLFESLWPQDANGRRLCLCQSPAECPASPDDCHTAVCDAGRCSSPLKPGFCFISGARIAAGTLHSTNPCRLCDPTHSTKEWSPVADGTGCNDGDSCTAPDTCQAGVCTSGPRHTWTPTNCQVSSVCDGTGGCAAELKICGEGQGFCNGPCMQANGSGCDANGDCCSGVCVNGVCQARKSELGELCDETADCRNGFICCDASDVKICVELNRDENHCGICGADEMCGKGQCLKGQCGTGRICPAGAVCRGTNSLDRLGICVPTDACCHGRQLCRSSDGYICCEDGCVRASTCR